MRRLFISAPSAEGERVRLTGQDAHYLLRVLRLGPGDRFSVIPSPGAERVATIIAVEAGEVVALLGDEVAQPADPRVEVRLFPGLPKAAKLEFIIQKCTELGVSAIQPVLCRRSVPRPAPADVSHKLARWERIALEAARQCGRSAPARLGPPAPLSEVLLGTVESGGTGLIFDLAETPSGPRSAALADADYREPINVLVGPEGGFAPEEVAEAVAAGFRPVGLGRRVLRAETAAIAVCAILLHSLGELG